MTGLLVYLARDMVAWLTLPRDLFAVLPCHVTWSLVTLPRDLVAGLPCVAGLSCRVTWLLVYLVAVAALPCQVTWS